MTSKAAIVHGYIQNLDEVKVEELPKPQVTPGQVLVKVFSAGINPVDDILLRGFQRANPTWDLPFPHTPGLDFSGVVEEVGDGVSGFAPGDEVFGMNWDKGAPVDPTPGAIPAGAFAEYLLVPATKLTRKPSTVSHDVAAGLGVVATTAYEGLVDHIQVKPGSRVLIFGGSSSVGIFAVQIAKILGAYVVTTASARSLSVVEQLGADRIINYQESKWEEDPELRDFDGIFDTIGEKDGLEKAVANHVIKADGAYATIANYTIGFNPAGHPPLRFAAFFGVNQSSERQEFIVNLVADGKIKTFTDETFPLTTEGVLNGLKKITGGKSLGKNIVKVV